MPPFETFRPDRRSFLAGAAALAATGLPRLALAAAPTDRRLVVLVLRGGMDGLAAVAPYADPAYAEVRGDLALAAPGRDGGVVDLDGRFGLHPALEPLRPWYQEGQLLTVHAIASPYRERSHFDAQDLLENGTARAHATSDGWLNRALALMTTDGRRLGLAIGQSVPLILRGPTPVASWAPSALPEADAVFLARMAALYRGDPVFAPALEAGLAASAMADHALGDDRGNMAMADRRAGRRRDAAALAEAAGKLLLDPAGPRIAVIDVPGWDTHAGQGTTGGRLGAALDGLARSLVALREALRPVWRDTAVLVVTEFGRTARPNGTGGTDHGTAGVALLAGGGVRGGRVLTEWPGLRADRLFQGRDLAPTADLRSLQKAVLVDHLGLTEADVEARVLPGSREAPRFRELLGT